MNEIRGGLRILSGPDAAQTTLRARDKATFTFQFDEGGSRPVEVIIVGVRHVIEGVYMILCNVGTQRQLLSYNVNRQIGVVMRR